MLINNTLKDHIETLKRQRNALILAHNYQNPEVQDIADFSGDSLELSQRAAANDKDVIVFCGVHFMAETAALLSPEKIVLLPDDTAGCPMADMVSPEILSAMISEHPEAAVVCYVNSTAEIKAMSDICCTSANAPAVVADIPDDMEIIFVPDQYLAGHVERTLGRRLITHPGYCPTHAIILKDHIDAVRTQHPNAPVLVHPECRAETCLAADHVLSTGGMVRFAKDSDADTIVVGTETGLIHRLQKENPHKTFIPLLDQAICPNMKLISMEKIARSLETMAPRVTVDPAIAVPARASIIRMLEGWTSTREAKTHV